MAAKHILLCIALLPMWALPPAHEATAYQVNKCHCIKRGKPIILKVSTLILIDNNSIDATPTMLQLTRLDVLEIGVSIRIMDRIGGDYHTLGTHLLNDEDGGIMRTIEHDYKFAEKIIDEMFHRWIKGHGQKNGKKTNTWEMLVKYLKHVKLMALADEIEAVLQFCTEKTMHLNDEECAHEYGERIHEALMETKSLYLTSMLAAIIIGAAIFRCRRKLKPIACHQHINWKWARRQGQALAI